MRRYNNAAKFTLVFICAEDDFKNAEKEKSPVIEITYNWTDDKGNIENITNGRAFGHVAFSVNNIYDYCKKLIKNNVIINRPPRDGYMTFIKTPDNISIELIQKGAPLITKEPWISMPNVESW